MAQRPERKKSTLGAAHPIDHQNSQPPAPEPVSSPGVSAPVLRAVEERLDGSQKSKPKPKGSFYSDEEELERIRASWYHTPTTSGEREASFSDFLREAALDRMMRREKVYNDGKPFPLVPAGKIARGRR